MKCRRSGTCDQHSRARHYLDRIDTVWIKRQMPLDHQHVVEGVLVGPGNILGDAVACIKIAGVPLIGQWVRVGLDISASIATSARGM